MQIIPLGERLMKIVISGRLDTPGVDSVEAQFTASLVPGANSAVVDLSGVDFVASMGIRMLLAAAKALKSRGARLALYGTQPQVSEVFDMVLLDQIVPVCATETEALALISTPAA